MTRHFARKRRTAADRHTALMSLLTWRGLPGSKPIKESELPGIATTHGTTVDKVREMARERGLMERLG